ncbi:MAG: glycosyltransferase [Alphaproteobacteria bacterium]|nr:glycosyltransferase [Alphaproteobacteria bacterium]
MHIRFLAGSLDVTQGGSAYDAHLIEALSRRGHEVSVISRTHSEPEGPVIIHGVAPVVPGGQGPWAMPGALLRGARQVNGVHCGTPDVVIASEHDFLRAHARRFPGVPWVYLPHCRSLPEEIGERPAGRFGARVALRSARWLQRWAVEHAATTVRFSRDSVEGMIDRLDLKDASRFTVIRPATWMHPAAMPPPEGGPLRMLVVGPLRTAKRVALVLEALETAPPEAPWECDVVGEGSEREALQARTAEAGLPVRFHGTCPDVGTFYARADLLLFPSRLEHAGLAIMEAMAHGVPVLAMDGRAPGIRTASNEMIDDGETGWLARSDEQFIGGVHRLIADPGAARTLRARTLEVARVRFDFGGHVDRWERLLHELASTGL